MSSFITRTERSGNIFFRVSGLIRSGQLTWAQRPLWYDVYVAHPPLSPPDWNVKLPKHDQPVRKIFYEEDTVRSQFYKKYRSSGIFNMNNKQDSVSQMFINEYKLVKDLNSSNHISDQDIFAETEKRMEEAGVKL